MMFVFIYSSQQAVPYENIKVRQALSDKFSVDGIPTLIVLDNVCRFIHSIIHSYFFIALACVHFGIMRTPFLPYRTLYSLTHHIDSFLIGCKIYVMSRLVKLLVKMVAVISFNIVTKYRSIGFQSKLTCNSSILPRLPWWLFRDSRISLCYNK